MDKGTEDAIRRGREAWGRIATDQTWEDWTQVGTALDLGRQECMRLVYTNEPRGRPFNEAFSRWLKENEFDTIEQSIRSRLNECMIHRAEIEAWRATLSLGERLRLNHPNGVLSKWKAKSVSGKATAGSKKEVVGKDAMIGHLKAEVERLTTNGGNQFDARTPVQDILKVIFTTLNSRKFTELTKLMLETLVEEQYLTREAVEKAKDDIKTTVLMRREGR